ncbi:MAG: hypothetical protein NTX86_02750 [Candidatus Dependentiae bacterium]|nr:hypothetical protein [Candidatus Dependentiae bacterium]
MKLFRARKHTQIKMKDRRLLSEIFQGKRIVLITLIVTRCLGSDNQTDLLTPVLVDKPLPFSICVKPSSITIPGGIQSSAAGQCESEILLIAGRTNGLHNFNNDNNNFPPSQQNTTIFVVNMHTKKVSSQQLHSTINLMKHYILPVVMALIQLPEIFPLKILSRPLMFPALCIG